MAKHYFLCILGVTINTIDDFNELSHFEHLYSILIENISIDNVELPENLEDIVMKNVRGQTDLRCIMKKFPKLIDVYFKNIDNLSDTAFSAFITLNPQIEKLEILYCRNLSFSAIDSISDHLPNLMELTVDCSIKSFTMHEYNEMVMHWSQLQKLKHLTICVPFEYKYPADILINMLVTNVPTIMGLHFVGLHFDFEKSVPKLLQLLHLKALTLLCHSFLIPVNKIVELVKGLPALEEIILNYYTISVSEIMNILEYSKDLTKLIIYICKIDINLSTYKSILSLIKGRLEVELKISNGIIDENIYKKKKCAKIENSAIIGVRRIKF